jgi:hypothetical protein
MDPNQKQEPGFVGSTTDAPTTYGTATPPAENEEGGEVIRDENVAEGTQETAGDEGSQKGDDEGGE